MAYALRDMNGRKYPLGVKLQIGSDPGNQIRLVLDDDVLHDVDVGAGQVPPRRDDRRSAGKNVPLVADGNDRVDCQVRTRPNWCPKPNRRAATSFLDRC